MDNSLPTNPTPTTTREAVGEVTLSPNEKKQINPVNAFEALCSQCDVVQVAADDGPPVPVELTMFVNE